MLGIWLFIGIFGIGMGLVLAARAFARGAAELSGQDQRLTWE